MSCSGINDSHILSMCDSQILHAFALIGERQKQQLIPTDHNVPGSPSDDCHMGGPLWTMNIILQKLLKIKLELL